MEHLEKYYQQKLLYGLISSVCKSISPDDTSDKRDLIVFSKFFFFPSSVLLKLFSVCCFLVISLYMRNA